MGEFKRSPSKVWWASESLEWREISSDSPGSQDSGFSDTETSPPDQIKSKNNNNNNVQEEKLEKNLYKEQSPVNLSINYQEKTTPEKNIKQTINQSPKRTIFIKNSPKVSRNLFNTHDKDKIFNHHQYSTQDTTHSSNSSEITCNDSCVSEEKLKILKTSKELSIKSNKTASAIIIDGDEEEDIFFNGNHSLSSDCESELECLFNGRGDSPKHTSTPKNLNKMRPLRQNKLPLNLYLKYQQEKIVLKILKFENVAVQKWMREIQQNCEQECMTTLQCKSIEAELHQKVTHIASFTTGTIRNILLHSECIEREYKHLNSERKHLGPVVQSLAGNIIDFLKTTTGDINSRISQLYDEVRKTKTDNLPILISKLFNYWYTTYSEILEIEIKRLVEKLEKPCSELDLRATITGITSLCLRNEKLIEIFTRNDAIPILLILCEKCEGSSMRTIIFRSLSTLCCGTIGIRQFEKYSGIQIISDTLEDDPSRPEPERSEAVALLAQITAPWIEDNHCIRGLQEYSRKFVKSLTKFILNTKCCQNLLLCTAALANLTTMESKSIKYILHLNTIQILLDTVNKRGPYTSIYLLEQVATLIANMTSLEIARKQLIQLKTVSALIYFLKNNNFSEDVEKRLQQKAIIALSRLCSESEAAKQVVELGGVEKLVKMCRDKEERFDSDAVLVATLATLRKIADACGKEVINSEDAQELVEPKLLDSFLAYSTQSESYV